MAHEEDTFKLTCTTKNFIRQLMGRRLLVKSKVTRKQEKPDNKCYPLLAKVRKGAVPAA